MLTHPTLDQLRALKLDGMADAFVELQSQDNARDLSHAEWLALLLDREAAKRDTSRFQSRLRSAKLRHSQAAIEDVDYRAARRLDKTKLCSSSSPPAAGSPSTATCSSPASAASGSRGSVVRWHRRPAATATPCTMHACQDCSPSWSWRTATAASRGCSER
jgi:hypothetical protein